MLRDLHNISNPESTLCGGTLFAVADKRTKTYWCSQVMAWDRNGVAGWLAGWLAGRLAGWGDAVAAGMILPNDGQITPLVYICIDNFCYLFLFVNWREMRPGELDDRQQITLADFNFLAHNLPLTKLAWSNISDFILFQDYFKDHWLSFRVKFQYSGSIKPISTPNVIDFQWFSLNFWNFRKFGAVLANFRTLKLCAKW